MMEVLSAREPAQYARWESLVDASPHPDVYYRPGYARAYEEVEHARACALLVGSAGTRALLPLMIRESSIGDESVRDAFSPYGYGGFCLLDPPEPPEPSQVRAMLHQVQEWCRAEQIVTCVIRLHPLLQPSEYFGNIASPELTLRCTGPASTVVLDLVAGWNTISGAPARMRKGRRSDLNSASRDLAVRIVGGNDPAGSKALAEFRGLYEATMARLSADPFLRFPAGYYERLAGGLGNRLLIAIATLAGVPAGTALFLLDGDFAHYHLSGTSDAGLKHHATTLLIVAGARAARDRGCRWLHLGGGMSPNDSLFDFKQSFGGSVHEYRALVLIADARRWARLRQAGRAPWPYSIK